MGIALENLRQGSPESEWSITGAGDPSNLGFCREFSVNVGEFANFSCSGSGTILDIYRIGWYGGLGWRKVESLTNEPVSQPDPSVVSSSNGARTCTAWSTTATWEVPEDAVSGMYVGVFRNLAGTNASWIPFVVRNDSLKADIIYKTSDATWALAYNYFNTMSSPFTGKSWYGSGGPMGDIQTRSHYASYHNPIVTRHGIPQTYWMACEYPLIRFLERNGYNVKYVTSKDLDQNPSLLDNGEVFLSSGHDEYWSKNMRDNVEGHRSSGGRSIFMSGNEVFWKMRYTEDGNGAWCYKDTMPGPNAHIAGTPLDPVEWTGTWKDTRWPDNKPEWLLTGTDFRMNGVNDFDAVISNPYAGHKIWGGSALNDSDIILKKVIGFEADSIRPTQPDESVRVLASYTRNINGMYADNNGQNYSGNGDLVWGIVSQRYSSGGLTVGFGTCQWSWVLDNKHDRGDGTSPQPIAQQFTVNLFHDLGVSPETLMSGMVLPSSPPNIDNYGLIPSLIGEGLIGLDGEKFIPYRLTDVGLVPVRLNEL